jgi:hypothetical protein
MFSRSGKAIAVLILAISLSSCWGAETIVSDIPDAENSLFTNTGRLFITGGKNIYEVTLASGTRFVKKALYQGEDNFCGITQVGNCIYAVRNTGLLFNKVYITAAKLSDSPVFKDIYQVAGVTMGNGLAADSSGRLYLADTGLTGKIVRLTISGSDPMTITGQSSWLTWGAVAPNGIKISGSTVFFTDLGTVKKVAINYNGTPGTVKTILSRLTIFDDLSLYNGKLIVCDYTKGTILYLSDSGSVLKETPAGTFFSPSSVIPGRAPMFSGDEFLITEKGILMDSNPAAGNRLTLFYLD